MLLPKPSSQRLCDSIPLQPCSLCSSITSGGLQLLQGKDDAALLSFSSALSKDPHEATTRFNRAKLFVQRKEYKAALTDFALLLSDHPKNELYRYQRAMALPADEGV